jgi:hypothetical protein
MDPRLSSDMTTPPLLGGHIVSSQHLPLLTFFSKFCFVSLVGMAHHLYQTQNWLCCSFLSQSLSSSPPFFPSSSPFFSPPHPLAILPLCPNRLTLRVPPLPLSPPRHLTSDLLSPSSYLGCSRRQLCPRLLGFRLSLYITLFVARRSSCSWNSCCLTDRVGWTSGQRSGGFLNMASFVASDLPVLASCLTLKGLCPSSLQCLMRCFLFT